MKKCRGSGATFRTTRWWTPKETSQLTGGFAELYFESQEAMEAALVTQDEGEATLADLPNFCDVAKTLGIAVEEVKGVLNAPSSSVETPYSGLTHLLVDHPCP